MRRLSTAILLVFASALCASHVLAQDARQRQAAAEAYDRGTAAYLDGSYAEAAQWFETAHRMAPAAPALMQASRAHQRAENFPRAATLALQLQEQYPGEASAAEYAKNVLSELAPKFVRVDVTCDKECKLDLDGTLQEFHSFFLPPGNTHTLLATFETGGKSETISGGAGEARTVQFEAPPAPLVPVKPAATQPDTVNLTAETASEKPLPPLVTYIGAGVTGVLLIGTILSAVDMNAGVSDYNKAAAASNKCVSTPGNTATTCASLVATATKKLTDGQGKELRTNVLIGVTAGVALITGVIALFLTDFSSHEAATKSQPSATLRVVPTYGGAAGVLEGRF